MEPILHFIELYNQYLSLLGAFLILLAYMGQQFNWKNLTSNDPAYNILNAIGAFILCLIALRPFVAGFFALELIWTIVSVVGLVKVLGCGCKKKEI